MVYPRWDQPNQSKSADCLDQLRPYRVEFGLGCMNGCSQPRIWWQTDLHPAKRTLDISTPKNVARANEVGRSNMAPRKFVLEVKNALDRFTPIKRVFERSVPSKEMRDKLIPSGSSTSIIINPLRFAPLRSARAPTLSSISTSFEERVAIAWMIACTSSRNDTSFSPSSLTRSGFGVRAKAQKSRMIGAW